MDEMEISKDPRLMELLTQVGGMPPEDLLAAEAGTQQPVINQGDEIVELGDDFDYEGYQVVRREFFAHMYEPAASFNNCKFYVNQACLTKFPDVDYFRSDPP